MFLFRCKTELASTESNLISFIFQHQQTTNFCNKKKIRKRFKTTFTKPHPQHPVHPLNQDPIKVYREFTIKVCPPWSSKLAKVRLNRLLHNRKYSVTKTPRLKSPWSELKKNREKNEIVIHTSIYLGFWSRVYREILRVTLLAWEQIENFPCFPYTFFPD